MVAPSPRSLSLENLLATYHTDKDKGLAFRQIVSHRACYGSNEFKTLEKSWSRLLLRQFNSGFTFLLAAAAVLSFALDEHTNAITILLIIVLMAFFGFYEEFYADRTLQELRARLHMHVRVLRNNEEIVINAEDLVCGDIVIVEPGDAICADVRLLEVDALLIDEASLTGESQPVVKYVIDGPLQEEKYPHAMLYAGTKVAAGTGRGVVIGVGLQTAFGKVVQAASTPSRLSNFAQGLNTFSLFVLYFVGGTIGTIFISHLWLQGASLNVLQLVVFYISLAVAVVPQALPVVINVALARAARRLAKRHVLVKRFAALEDLASVEVLCVDKTGTLTENHLTVSNLWAATSQTVDEVLLAAFQGRAIHAHKQIDAFDRALIEALNEQKRALPTTIILKQLPFDPLQKCNVTLVHGDQEHVLILRGALEAVLARCEVDAETIVAGKAWAAVQEDSGLRVLFIAQQVGDDIHTQKGYHLMGALAFQDRIKPSAAAALQNARAMRVMVKMLTGDSPNVARQVAQALHIFDKDMQLLTGEEYEALSAAEKDKVVLGCNVFARVSPLQKYDIIQRLEQIYDVGFVGEGINDVPSLKVATVGFAVHNAVEAAKDAADLVLLSRSVQTLVEAVQQGRAVFVNTAKYLRFTLASNFSNFYTLAIISLINAKIPMLPVQLLALNVISDIPMLFVATDSVEAGELEHPVSSNVKNLITKTMFFGAVCSIFDFFFLSLIYQRGPALFQTNWFVFSILSELALYFPLRSAIPFWRATLPSWQLLIALASVAVIGTLLPFTSLGQGLLHLQPLAHGDFMLMVGVVLLNMFAVEAMKKIWYRYFSPLGR